MILDVIQLRKNQIHLTVQPPKHLLNEHPHFDFGKLEVRTLKRGDWNDIYTWLPLEYPVAPEQPPDTPMTSANWNGYIETLRLNADGTLSLVCYDFHNSKQDVDVLIPGDFFMVCSEIWGGETTLVPFADGQIVDDRQKWIIEPPTISR